MRIPFLIAAAVFLTVAAPASGLEDDVARCAGLSSDAARLACYDAIAAHLKAALVPAAPVLAAQSAPPPAAQTTPLPAAAPVPAAKPAATQAQFGAENLAQPAREAAGQPDPLDEIKASVTEVYFSHYGRFVVTLANGQIWRQIDGDTGRARFNKKGGDGVMISRGLFGSYNLVIDGHAGLFKVARVK